MLLPSAESMPANCQKSAYSGQGCYCSVSSDSVPLGLSLLSMNQKARKSFKMKPWYKSKIVWAGMIQVSLSLLTIVKDWWEANHDKELDLLAWLVLATGILTLVSRWLTDEPITSFSERFDTLPKRRDVVERYERKND
jgi:hypothetical protein